MIRSRGELVTATVFSVRVSYSGKAIHQVRASAGQKTIFEAHAHALGVRGGVPTARFRYDNLRAAAANVISVSRQRVETDR